MNIVYPQTLWSALQRQKSQRTVSVPRVILLKSYCAEFEETYIFVYFESVLSCRSEIAQVVEIIRRGGQWHVYPVSSISEYHCCWYAGDTRSYGISSHDVGLLVSECTCFSTRRFLTWPMCSAGLSFNSLWPRDVNMIIIGDKCWLVTCSVPSHTLNQCWLIVNCVLRNTFAQTLMC